MAAAFSSSSPRLQLIIPCGLAVGVERNGHMAEACAGWLQQLLQRWPAGGVALAINGELLDAWIRHQPGFLGELGRLVEQHRVEILSQPFYGGDAQAWLEQDMFAQLQMAQECWSSYLAEPPLGLYAPSHGWCPSLVAIAQQVGLAYGIVPEHLLAREPWLPEQDYVQLEALGYRMGCFVGQVLSAQDPSQFTEQWQQLGLASQARASHLPAQSVLLGHHWQEGMRQLPWLLSTLQESGVQPIGALKLPRQRFAAGAPGVPAKLVWAKQTPLVGIDRELRWEVDVLHRVNLALGQKLQEALLNMQHEHSRRVDRSQQRWSGELATAQRYLASAQQLLDGLADQGDEASRSVWRAGMWEKIHMARELLDGLEQSTDVPWLALEEACLDGDGIPECILTGMSQTVAVGVQSGLRMLMWQEGRQGWSLLHPSWPGAHSDPVMGSQWGPGAWFGATGASLDGSAFFAGRMLNHWQHYPQQGWEVVEQSFSESPQVSGTLFGRYAPPASLSGEALAQMPAALQAGAQVGLEWQWRMDGEQCGWQWQVQQILPAEQQGSSIGAEPGRWLVSLPCILPGGGELAQGEQVSSYRQWTDCEEFELTSRGAACLRWQSNLPMHVWLQPAPKGFGGGVWLALSVPVGPDGWQLDCQFSVA